MTESPAAEPGSPDSASKFAGTENAAAEEPAASGRPVRPPIVISDLSRLVDATRSGQQRIAAAVEPAPVHAPPVPPVSAAPAGQSRWATATSTMPAAGVAATGETEFTRVVDTGEFRRHRRAQRWTMTFSTLLGTGGLLAGLLIALFDQLRYDLAIPCLAYANAHLGARGFGCSTGDKHLSVALPAIGFPLVVLLGLGFAWIPQRGYRYRAYVLASLLVALAAGCALAYFAYTALPQNT